MQKAVKHHGVVVPMVTPVTVAGEVDMPAVDRLVDYLLAAGVEGVFLLGTTGEGVAVPEVDRIPMVKRAVSRARGRSLVYAGIGNCLTRSVEAANAFFDAGVDAVVARPPVSLPEEELLPWFQNLLDGAKGQVILYNIPTVSNVSIPLDVVGKLMGHERLAGIKDSENDGKRLEKLVGQFGRRAEFSIFIGVGALMARGLKLGAVGIVPSVGNLIPEVCRALCVCAARGDWAEAEKHFARMNAVAALYQKGRTLSESLSVLKAAVHCRGLCEAHVLPPLRAISDKELEALRLEMTGLRLLG